MQKSNLTTEPCGVIVIDKHEGVSSFRIIQILRKLYNTRKVGHTGTLDPLATGVLPVLIGRAVKASEFIMSEDKSYTAEMRLGIETDTEDITGTVTNQSDVTVSKEDVRRVCSEFIGEISQIPPMYSAIKQNGQRLHELARKGETVEREPRLITVKGIEVSKINDLTYKLNVECSKGTYIRTLCTDIGRRLGCFATMSSLRRTRSGSYTLDKAHTVSELEELSYEERCNLLCPTESAFVQSPSVELGDFFFKLASCGAEIYLHKIGAKLVCGELVRMNHGGEFFALGRVEEFPDGEAIRPVKQFSI